MMPKIVQGGSKNRCAYVCTVFGGDSYIPGAMTLAYSLKKVGTDYDIVCMVTDDVSESAKNRLRGIGVTVVDIPYLEYKTKPMRSQKMENLYSAWIGKSYTKWNCLNLDYDKILFLDADLIVNENIDHLFELKAPASRFSMEIFGKKQLPRYVKPNQIEKELKNNGSVINASIVLLNPNKKHFNNLKSMISSMQPFGFNCLSGADEQSLAYYMSVYKSGPKLSWQNLGPEYLFSWRNKDPVNKIYIHNFTGAYKPWNRDIIEEFPDTKPWYDMYELAHIEYPELFPILFPKNI